MTIKLYENLTNDTYHQSDGYVSSSTLKLFPEQIDQYLALKVSGSLKSEALIFGSAYHSLILEPENFDNEYAISPSFNLRTKEGKENKKNFEEENEGKEVLTSDQFETMVEMSNVCSCHPVNELLKPAKKELSFYGEVDGLRQKVRADAINEKAQVVFDLKTTSSVEDFEMAILKYKYHLSAVMYSRLISEFYGKEYSFQFIVQQKKHPYTVRVVALDEEFEQAGLTAYGEAKKAYKDYVSCNFWDYIKLASIPPFIKKF